MSADLLTDSEKIVWLVKAVSYVGVDFGFGEFKLNYEHIETARELTEKINNPKVIVSMRELKE